MSQAPQYLPGHIFAIDNSRSGRSPIKTARLDAELTSISNSIEALRRNLAAIQTDQGNVIISAISLTADAIAIIAGAVGVVVGPIGPTGLQGIQGIQGNIGPQGVQGIQGVIGIQGFIGGQGPQGLSFEPDAIGTFAQRSNFDVQQQGFSYLANDLAMIYFRIGLSGWSAGIGWGQGPTGATGATGAAGAAGASGATWRTGATVPVNTLGVDGDLYLKTDTADVYKRASGAYGVTANIRGTAGLQGPAGPIGPPGGTGSVGASGVQGPIGPQGAQGPQGPQGPTNSAAETALRLSNLFFQGSGQEITDNFNPTGFATYQRFARIKQGTGIIVSRDTDGSILISIASGGGGA